MVERSVQGLALRWIEIIDAFIDDEVQNRPIGKIRRDVEDEPAIQDPRAKRCVGRIHDL